MLSPRRRPAAQFRFERLEDRITPSFGGTPPSAISLPASSLLTLNSSGDISGTASIASNEIDWFRFTVNAGTTTIATTTPSSSLDSYIALYNSNGQRVAFNDDTSNSDTDSRLNLNLLRGTYYLGVTNFDSSTRGGYSLFVNGPSNSSPPTTPRWSGGTPPTTTSLPASIALTLNSSGDFSGTAAITNNEIDWYRFTLRAGATTITTTTPNSSLDSLIGLYNSNGQRVAFNDDISSSNNESRLNVNLSAGTYFLGVTNFDTSTNGSYTLSINGPSNSSPPPVSSGFGIQLRFSGFTASQQNVLQQAANRWAQVITGDLPNMTYNGVAVDDLLIDVTTASIDGASNTLASAGPDRFRSGSQLPYHGNMRFDTADLARLESSGQLISVALHEMGHVLGIGTIWDDRGLISGEGSSNPRFRGAQATAQYNSIFGRNETSVPVENVGGQGSVDSHWRESVLGTELMTSIINSATNPLSRITVGSLADIGYQVNYNAASAYSRPSSSLVAGGGNSVSTENITGSFLRSAEPIVSVARAFDADFANRKALPGLTNATPPRLRATEAIAFESLDHLTRGIRVDAPTTTPAMRTSVDKLVYLDE